MAPEVGNGDIVTPADKEQLYFTMTDARRFNSSGRINIERSTSSRGMQRKGFDQFENFSPTQTTRPPHLRRRITIGGSGPHVEGIEHNSWSSDTRTPSATRQGGHSQFQPAKSHYPPTSWRPSPPAQPTISDFKETGLSESSSSGGVDGEDTKAKATVCLEGTYLNPPFPTSTRASNPPANAKNPQASFNTTPQLSPARSNSHRRYIIGFSGSTVSANAGGTQNGRPGAPAASRRASSGPATLPDPHTAYSQTYYYTVCAHASPPKSRPLNVQPTLVQYRKGLLAYPPFHLRAYNADQASDPPTICVLEGSCSDCDITTRRQAESKVLDTYTHQLENLYIQLNLLQKDIAIENSNMSFPEKSQDEITAFSFPSTLELGLEETQAILEIEDQLDQLGRLAFTAKTRFAYEVDQELLIHETLCPGIQWAQQPPLASLLMIAVLDELAQ
ncbi:hypothetical protein AYO22_03614 [Fonsecaea multimorphosa]|nr:hypothetical protein AYO22_03614 [Fonsecaea multimorphosa]